ncbi:MAG: LssY C-terminal domain-containing protein, partial [Gemmatimonadaceae bacterium]
MPDRARLPALLIVVLVMVTIYLAAQVAASRLFTHHEYAAELEPLPTRTTDAFGHPGDPINVAIVGSRDELRTAMRMAGWVVADSLTRASKIAIARSVLFNRPDSAAPVSPLFLLGRQQDIAFEREVGSSARRR